jgi:hypothetical protein
MGAWSRAVLINNTNLKKYPELIDKIISQART